MLTASPYKYKTNKIFTQKTALSAKTRQKPKFTAHLNKQKMAKKAHISHFLKVQKKKKHKLTP